MDTITTPPGVRGPADASGRAGLWIVGVGAALVALTHVVGTVLGARHTLGDDPLEVEGIPVSDASAPAFTEHLPAISEARYGALTAVVEGVPAGTRWLLWAGDAVGSLAVVGICLVLVQLCVRIARQRPFGRSLTVALVATAVLVTAGGVLPQLLALAGRTQVVEHLGVATMAAETGVRLTVSSELSLASIGVGLALCVVAVAFALGERMQRDTAGLV
ncbi:hypothetical protein SAMN05216184_10725 [Georgenia satyanarayanai]|uniref:DUF2975 domain-containing protein n=1 Tax=Georgenia satyanarayanai TaxID=860221 RepID=A0A2Y9AIM2_9MICO|nr:hypothetical protein [Georgenia satyanarayanai]PYF99316.1 hypothetical protein A8987_10725 [Georgenia satyanarayanai]SSA43128.1 hypothetical protein SAMN05216184_10725 [Georgenia satyanarayanai]